MSAPTPPVNVTIGENWQFQAAISQAGHRFSGFGKTYNDALLDLTKSIERSAHRSGRGRPSNRYRAARALLRTAAPFTFKMSA